MQLWRALARIWLSSLIPFSKEAHLDAEQAIHSEDMTLKRVLQDFYRVPDYQREYVWGEADPKGERGDEVEQFLNDINTEFEAATDENAPEYFIGTVVVCPSEWPAPGSEDTKLGVLVEPEVRHGEAEVHARVQA
jgi:Protein of unknown function DUF262